jgi:chromatin segregation and condensation protein Rec8/ScpA/Scc1 (kleisin family)
VTDTKPIVRGRQVVTNKALNKLSFTKGPVTVDVESARYGKEINREGRQAGYGELPAYRRYAKATQRLSRNERAALNIIPRDVHPADLAEFWKGTDLEKVVADPRVQKLVLDPSPRLQRALDAARELSAKGEDLFKEQGYLERRRLPRLDRGSSATPSQRSWAVKCSRCTATRSTCRTS